MRTAHRTGQSLLSLYRDPSIKRISSDSENALSSEQQTGNFMPFLRSTMKLLIVAILGVFLTQALANDNIKINNSGNDGGSVSQQVNINNQDQVANINNLNGWNSWDSICDFGRGFAATRLYNKKVCVLTKIKPSFPTLEQLSTIAKTKQVPTNTNLVTYTINQTPIVNIGAYGQHIESLCRGMPAYTAQEMPSSARGFAVCCSSSSITILGFNFCF